MKRHQVSIALILGVAVIGCGGGDDGVDDDLGPIDEIVSFADRVNWPGVEEANGRVINMIRGFAEEKAAGYWFLGFASKKTADSFWFCREGDTNCPLDANQQLNWDTLVGQPIFARMPGQPDFSPFWQMWKVTVPADYEPNTIKTTDTINALAEKGELTVEPFIIDFGTLFGEEIGFRNAVLHCALVLTGTTLAENGEMLPDGSGKMKFIETRLGWHEGYQVEFIDFSTSDGVFAESDESENRPLMRFANIYIHWRPCDMDPRPAICDIPGHAYTDKRPVSERGLGQDLTGDSDANDTNNTMGGLPCEAPLREEELPYSPLWAINNVLINDQMEPPPAIAMIDTNADQAESDVMSAAEIFARVDVGEFNEPELATEDSTGNPVPGNEGQLFFNCPNPVPETYVPFPCSANE